jgi:peptidoglycan/LPS O-acetylase OafA/YrhL
MRRFTIPEHQPGRVDELDGLRGLLALWVAVAHILCWTGFRDVTLPRPFRLLWLQFIGAGPAVDTFIVLSGFAISFLLHNRPQSYGQFIQGRFFRIYPVYGVCLGLGLMTALFTPFVLETASWRDTVYFAPLRSVSSSEFTATGPHVFWHMTLLNGLIPKQWLSNSTATFLPPAWSVSLEWQYYLVAPLVARFVMSGAGLVVLALVAWFGVEFGHAWQNPHRAFLPEQLPLFLIGIGSYHLFARFAVSEPHSLVRAASVAALLAVAVLTTWHPTALVAWALGFGCIVVRGNDPFSRRLLTFRGILLHPWLQGLGRFSYPLYLVHWPLIVTFLAALLLWRPDISFRHAALLMFAFGLPLILWVAYLLHLLVEHPLMSFGRRLSSRAQQPPGENRAACGYQQKSTVSS